MASQSFSGHVRNFPDRLLEAKVLLPEPVVRPCAQASVVDRTQRVLDHPEHVPALVPDQVLRRLLRRQASVLVDARHVLDSATFRVE